MQNGVYMAVFHVGPNSGRGIVTISGNQVSGGDEGFTYVGTLDDHGGQLTAQVEVKQHDPAHQNVFTGLTHFYLDATGNAASPTSAKLHGTTPAAPGYTVHVHLDLLVAI